MAEEPSLLPPWMKALAGIALAAALANAALVWMSLRGRRDLVRSDYYQAGLEQDARLARRNLAAAYRFGFTAGPEAVFVRAGKPFAGSPAARGPAGETEPAGSKCRIRFSRPDDDREDRVVELAWMEAGQGFWQGPGLPLRTGRWDVLIEWEKGGKVIMESAFPRYFHE